MHVDNIDDTIGMGSYQQIVWIAHYLGLVQFQNNGRFQKNRDKVVTFLLHSKQHN